MKRALWVALLMGGCGGEDNPGPSNPHSAAICDRVTECDARKGAVNRSFCTGELEGTECWADNYAATSCDDLRTMDAENYACMDKLEGKDPAALEACEALRETLRASGVTEFNVSNACHE